MTSCFGPQIDAARTREYGGLVDNQHVIGDYRDIHI
jgi:hypothetical protein